ncbi:TonB-dependent receptor domain-containing protein [Alteromonas mediterranea]|uniref:TonB-dependent receptor domain-containing protein n=1 Tax=Alteromonas mediterranea TaxID=314275 RepID=UPI001E3B2154|nr:TonB-dependent receptor [Alteromonas mediterranea]
MLLSSYSSPFFLFLCFYFISTRGKNAKNTVTSSGLCAGLFFSFVSPLSLAQHADISQLERYTVTATRPYYDETLSRIFPQYQFDKSHLVTPLHTNELLLQAPSVSLNGQGGQIQSISIRGYSRWRIQTLLDGVPIVSDRRAGSSIGFVPPEFITSVSVLPGAASTYLGSGALGGAVNLQLDATENPYLNVGYSSNQQMKTLSYKDSVGNTDWNIAYRNANKGEDANGALLFDQFEQAGLFLRHRPESGFIKEAWTLYSDNNNIGKSSSDYPLNRISTYPDNTHWLGKLTVGADNYTGSIWWHQSYLETSVLRPQSRINDSENKALDYGFDIKTKGNWQDWWFNWQLQVSGRDGVEADEKEFSLTAIPVEQGHGPDSIAFLEERAPVFAYEVRTLNANEINAAGIVDASRQWNSTSLALGARVDWQRQSDNTGTNENVTATNLSGYIGVNYQLAKRWATSLYVSSAFRNPSLTERFFAGETPRGTVIGSTKLQTESALNSQATFAYNSEQLQGAIDVFYQQIDNYIERQAIADDVLQYANLDSATIKGLSYQLSWQSKAYNIDATLSGAWVNGRDELGNAIADIPADNHRFNVGMTLGSARFFTTVVYRANKSDVAEGERTLDDVITLDVGGSWRMNERIVLQASWENLTNQRYYTSTDDKAPFAQGKSIQLALTYLL